MYAVIETGGKQYRVKAGDEIDIELLPVADDEKIVFDRVLMAGEEGDVQVGTPTLEGATVNATLVREFRGPKVLVFKMKRRKGYRRKNGHRQNLLRVRIQDIQLAS
jgi:large subunit ribosomal protein L21